MEPNTFIKNLKAYPSASHKAWDQADKSQVLKMDWNESDLALPESVKQAGIDFIAHGPTNWYPDTANRELIRLLAAYAGVSEDSIQYYGGEDSALDYAVHAYVAHGDRVGIVSPTYDNFRVFVESVGAAPVYLMPENLFEPNVTALKKQIIADMRMVYLVNPNNPTGVQYTVEEIEELVRSFPNTMFIVDEAYAEFADIAAAPLIKKYKNIIIGRSLSKSFGLASFRLGYFISAPENLAAIDKIRNGKNIPAVAQVCAIAALKDTSYVQAYLEEVRKARTFLTNELTALGFSTRETTANFILIEVPDPKAFCAALETRNVYIRNLGHLPQMEHYARVSVGRRDNAQRFVDIVRELLQHGIISTT